MRTLVLCTWWDGGPDCEYYAHKVLDENFNEVEIPAVEYPLVLDLCNDESKDEERKVYWSDDIDERWRPYAPQEMLDDNAMVDAAWEEWHNYNDECDAQFGPNWNYEDEPEYNKECTEKADALWHKAHDLDVSVSRKYKNTEPFHTYTKHSIGVEEFCKMHGIDKVIRLK